jgi:hypothetical protein
MADLLIPDEQISRRLLNLAKEQNRSVEALLEAMLNTYEAAPSKAIDNLRAYRLKTYAKARLYWQSVGDTERANLTDAELDREFWLFDGETPRLKSDQDKVEIPENSLIRLAEIAEQNPIEVEASFDAANADDILNEEYAAD